MHGDTPVDTLAKAPRERRGRAASSCQSTYPTTARRSGPPAEVTRCAVKTGKIVQIAAAACFENRQDNMDRFWASTGTTAAAHVFSSIGFRSTSGVPLNTRAAVACALFASILQRVHSVSF